MTINKVLKDSVLPKEIINSGNHYVYVINLSSAEKGNPKAVDFLLSLGFDNNRAWEMYRTVTERCEVGTLYPTKITLLPQFFWLDEHKREEYLADLLKADDLMKSKAIYVMCEDLDFEKILSASSNVEINNKNWYIIV